MRLATFVTVVCLTLGLVPAGRAGLIWDLEAVDAAGKGTHVSLDWPNPTDPDHDEISESMVVAEGILLNRSDDYLDPATTFQVYVQGDGGGGVAVYAGKWYQSGIWATEYERMSKDPTTGHEFEAGDRVRVTGLTLFYKGKTNINERHEEDPEYDVTIKLIAAGAGMPAPQFLPAVAECNTFDQTRATGAEHHQGQWCRFADVEMLSGTWAAGETIQISDNGVDTFDVLLSATGDFSAPAPTGRFSVTGIFDQEDDGSSPYTDGYRLWVKDAAAFGAPLTAVVAEPAAGAVLALGAAGLGARRRRRRG